MATIANTDILDQIIKPVRPELERKVKRSYPYVSSLPANFKEI